MILKISKLRDYRLHHHLRTASQISLLVLSLITLVFCKQISGYFADYNREVWFSYFTITERFSMMMLLLSNYTYLKSRCWIIFELLLFFLAQDFVDRVFFNIKEWNSNDTIGLMLIGLQIILKIFKAHEHKL